MHTHAARRPRRTAVRGWTADLAALPRPEPGVLRVLAGDFNASLDHAALPAVLGRGYTDAAPRGGPGAGLDLGARCARGFPG